MGSIVYVTGKNGIRYAYWNESSRNKETGRVEHKRTSMGQHIDPVTGELVPNRKKGDAARKRKEEALAQAGQTEPYIRWSSKKTGDVLLLNHVVGELGLQPVLAAAFPEQWQKILTCAYYLVSTGSALCRAEAWADERDAPCAGQAVASQRTSELLGSITDSEIHEFFAKWGGRACRKSPARWTSPACRPARRASPKPSSDTTATASACRGSTCF